MDLTDLRTALRRHWIVALAAFLVCLVTGVAMAFVPATKYKSTTYVVTALPPSGATDAVQYASFQIPVLALTIESTPFIEGARATLPPALRTADVAVTARTEPGTGALHIDVVSHRPEATAPWATALAQQAVDSEQGKLLDLRVLEPAFGRGSPTSSSKLPILLASALLGVLTATVAAVIAFRVTGALDLGAEIERRAGLPVVGRIRRTRTLRQKGGARVVGPGGASELVETFKAIRTSIALTSPGGLPSVIAVTSWSANEGASTVAAGLAAAIAESGRPTLAVDADLRDPTLHQRLGLRFGAGVADAMRADVEALVVPALVPHLWFVPAGVPDRHPADIVVDALERVLELATMHGRCVIIDAPPLDGRAETAAVLARAHHVLVVVDGRRPRVAEIEATAAQLRKIGVTPVGIVLNRVRASRHRRVPTAAHQPVRPENRALRPLTVVDHEAAEHPSKAAVHQR